MAMVGDRLRAVAFTSSALLLLLLLLALACVSASSELQEAGLDRYSSSSSNETADGFVYDEYFEYDEYNNQTTRLSNRTQIESTAEDYRQTLVYNYNYNVTEDYDAESAASGNESTSWSAQDWFAFDGPVVANYDLLRLRRSLLWMYDKGVRPVDDSSKPIDVHIGVSIVQINSLDEMYQVITTTLQVSLRWYDNFLNWNQSVYNGTMTFKSNEIWVPDITVINNVNSFRYSDKETFMRGFSQNIFDYGERNKYFILVEPSGQCRWVFPLKVMSSCQLNQKNFPFDTQTCHLDFKSTAYRNHQLRFKKFRQGVHLQLINEGEFDLKDSVVNEINVSSKAAIDDESNFVSIVRINLTMNRKMLFYLNKIILPYGFFYVVIMLTYILPVESGEKKSYCTSILISCMMYLKESSYYIPKTSDLPFLSIYFNFNLIIVYICIIMSTIVYGVYFSGKGKQPVPALWKKIIFVGRIFRLVSCSKPDCSIDNAARFKALNASLRSPLSPRTISCSIDAIDNQLVRLNRDFLFKKGPFLQRPFPASPHKVGLKFRKKSKLVEPSSSAVDLLAADMLSLMKLVKYLIARGIYNACELTGVEEKIGLPHGESIDSNKLERYRQSAAVREASNLKYMMNLESLKQKVNKGSTPKEPSRRKYQDESEKQKAETDGYKYLKAIKFYKRRLESRVNRSNSVCPEMDESINRLNRSQFENRDRVFSFINTNILFETKSINTYMFSWKHLACLIDRIIFIYFFFFIPACLIVLYMKTILDL